MGEVCGEGGAKENLDAGEEGDGEGGEEEGDGYCLLCIISLSERLRKKGVGGLTDSFEIPVSPFALFELPTFLFLILFEPAGGRQMTA